MAASTSEATMILHLLVFRFDLLPNFRANSRLDEIRRSRQSEIARLEALLRKAEMKVSSLERTVDQKSRENQELTVICDELIAKVGGGGTGI